MFVSLSCRWSHTNRRQCTIFLDKFEQQFLFLSVADFTSYQNWAVSQIWRVLFEEDRLKSQLRSSPWRWPALCQSCWGSVPNNYIFVLYGFVCVSLSLRFSNKARWRNISTCHDTSHARLSRIKVIKCTGVDETNQKGAVFTGCRQSIRLQKPKPNKLHIRKSPAPAAFIHLVSNLFTFNSCWLSSSCRTSPGLLCRYLSPWHATTPTAAESAQHDRRTFTPFQIHCSLTGTGLTSGFTNWEFPFCQPAVNCWETGRIGIRVAQQRA